MNVYLSTNMRDERNILEWVLADLHCNDQGVVQKTAKCKDPMTQESLLDKLVTIGDEEKSLMSEYARRSHVKDILTFA